MSSEPKIEFVLRDRVDGVEITPATIGFSRFNDFNQQVEDFIAGSEKLKLDEVHVGIEKGSYKLITLLPFTVLAALEPDLHSLQRQDSLAEIDPKRADVISKWQARSKGNPDLHFLIRPVGVNAEPIELSSNTNFRMGEIVPWVKVEKYLFGTVLDMGGVQKANVHIRLDDSGQIVRIGSNQGYLKNQTENRLYKKVLARVEADQHYRTGQWRNLRLLSFEDYEQKYDPEALDRFIESGTRAWKDVPDAAGWVRELRGGSA
jgi:hypothetical protein